MENKNLRRQAIEERSRARRLLLQLLYQYQLAHQDIESLLANRIIDPSVGNIDEQYLHEALEIIIKYSATLDKKLTSFSKRKMRLLDPVERAILWIAAYEFLGRSDIPKSVIINEAIELAKRFGSDDGYKFVNGILDKFMQAGHTRLNLEDETQEEKDL